MSYTRTLAQLRTSVQVRGSYEGSDDITPAVLLEVINDALEETYNICVACDDDYLVRLGSPVISTVAGQDTYAWPSDFYNLRRVEYLSTAGRWLPVHPVSLDGASRVQSYGLTSRTRYRYRVTSAGLVLVPIPTSNTDQLRIYYLPLAPQLVADTDMVTFDRPVEQRLVLLISLRDCLDRQNLSTAEMDMKIEKLSKTLRTIADTHDEGEPEYLSDRRDDDDEDY